MRETFYKSFEKALFLKLFFRIRETHKGFIGSKLTLTYKIRAKVKFIGPHGNSALNWLGLQQFEHYFSADDLYISFTSWANF